MLKITAQRQKEEILEDLVNALNKEDKFFTGINEITSNFFIEYTMSILGVNEVEFEYVDLGRKTISLVIENDNVMKFSESLLTSPSKQTTLLLAILHEMKHIEHANNKQKNKVFNKSPYPLYPMKECSLDSIEQILDNRINNNYYYTSSVTEKEARDFANHALFNFLNEVIKHPKSTLKTKFWAKQKLNQVKKVIKQEKKDYKKAVDHVLKTNGLLKDIILQKVNKVLEAGKQNANFLHTVYGNARALSSLLYFYCDNNITTKVIDFAKKFNDIDTYIMCLNHPNTIITEKNFKEFLSYYYKGKKIENLQELLFKFSDWKKEVILQVYSEYNNKLEKTQKPTKKYKKTKKLSKKQQKETNTNKNNGYEY